MRRILTAICVSLFLMGGALSAARATPLISIAGDALLDISVRDADRGDVLSTLFSATHSAAQKRVLVLQDSVTGHIDRLQIVQATFDGALGTVLGSDYRYQLEVNQGVATYRVSLSHPPAPSSGAIVQGSTPAVPTAKPNSSASADGGLVLHYTINSANNTAPTTGTPATTPPGSAPNNVNQPNGASAQNNANQPNGAGAQNNANQPNGANSPNNANYNPAQPNNAASSFYMNASLDSNGTATPKPIYYTPTPDGGYTYGTPGTNGHPGSFWYIGPQSQWIAVPINVNNSSNTPTPTPTTGGGTAKK